ncbi:helix-turn-helix domain-containing protein [Cohnella endophytica]|nr:helix-turn-helix domain-containing protein [Cohnella endophytica]
MHQAILVDDDVAVLEFLKQLVPWGEMGFELAGAFTNAYDALGHCKEAVPDLIVTDIGMPGMDGLAFIRELQAKATKSRFVILSCHDEFLYAQQAVQLGVQDYVLKETLTLESMQELIGKAKRGIDDERRLKLQVDRLHDQAHKSQSARKEKWLRDLLSYPVSEDGKLFEQLQEFGLNAKQGHFIPVCCRIHRYHDAIIRYNNEEMVKFIAENAAEELLREEQNLMFVGYSSQTFFLLCACRKELVVNPFEKVVRISNVIQQAFSKYLKIELSVLVGEMVSGGSELKRQTAALLETDELFYSHKPVVLKYSEIQQRQASATEQDLFQHYSDVAERLNRLLIENNGGSESESVVDSFFSLVRSGKFPPSDVKQFVWKLALDMRLKLKFSRYFDKEKAQHDLGRMLNVSEVRDWLLLFMKEAVAEAEQISKKSKKTEIVDAQRYVQLQLHRKITLEEVADHLHLNPSYFSRLFKKESGENFIEYVTRLKMEKAKELLGESGHTVEKIALQLGYDNKSYFVKLFKQHYGTAPGRFV